MLYTILPYSRPAFARYVVTICAVLVTCISFGQHSISGRVLNGQDQTPLPGTNVFLAQTTKGTVTDAEGRFTISGLKTSKYQLVVSHIGFKTVATTIELPVNKPYRIVLQPDASQLDAITVRAKRKKGDNKREAHLAYFIKYFVGQSENAKLCRLTNPDALYFDDKEDLFVAHATEPLQIVNEALGFTIKFQLDSFSVNNSTHIVYYKGYSVFDTLASKDTEQTSFWAAQRRKAYYGSYMHFMRALYLNQLSREGFVVRDVREKRYQNGEKKLVAMVNDSSIAAKSLLNGKPTLYPTIKYSRIIDTVRSTPVQPILKWPDILEVRYTREAETYDYYRHRDQSRYGYQKKPQTSMLRLLQPTVIVQADGQSFEPDGVKIQGYWSWELLADDLPFDYVPDTQPQ